MHMTAIPFAYVGDDRAVLHPASDFNDMYQGEKVGFSVDLTCPVCGGPVGLWRFSKKDPHRGYFLVHKRGSGCSGSSESIWHAAAKQIPKPGKTMYIPVPTYQDRLCHTTTFTEQGDLSDAQGKWHNRKTVVEPVRIIEAIEEDTVETGQHPDVSVTIERRDGSQMKFALEIRYKHAKEQCDVERFAEAGIPVLEVTIGDVIPENPGDAGWEAALEQRVLGTFQEDKLVPREWLYYPDASKVLLSALQSLVGRRIIAGQYGTDIIAGATPLKSFNGGIWMQEPRYFEFEGKRLPEIISARTFPSSELVIEDVEEGEYGDFVLLTDIGKACLRFPDGRGKPCDDGYALIISIGDDYALTPEEMFRAISNGNTSYYSTSEFIEQLEATYERVLLVECAVDLFDPVAENFKPFKLSAWRKEKGKVAEGTFVFDIGETFARAHYLWLWRRRGVFDQKDYLGRGAGLPLLSTPLAMQSEAEEIIISELSKCGFEEARAVYRWNDADLISRGEADKQAQVIWEEKSSERENELNELRKSRDTRWLMDNDPEIKRLVKEQRARDGGAMFPCINKHIECNGWFGDNWRLYVRVLGKPVGGRRQQAYLEQMSKRNWSTLEPDDARKHFKLADYAVVEQRSEFEVGMVLDPEHADKKNRYGFFEKGILEHALAELFFSEEEWFPSTTRQSEARLMSEESLFGI